MDGGKENDLFLVLDPKDFHNHRARIYNYFKEKNWGKDYIKKLTRMSNLWGEYYARKTNSFISPPPPLSQTFIENNQ
ncbi:hypothetical protein BDW_04940 [Bdellovibrio bacteriovorus W]|nr:hypothetical protein BDW_04940 [Bdellovibrio bacteriovorus W]